MVARSNNIPRPTVTQRQLVCWYTRAYVCVDHRPCPVSTKRKKKRQRDEPAIVFRSNADPKRLCVWNGAKIEKAKAPLKFIRTEQTVTIGTDGAKRAKTRKPLLFSLNCVIVNAFYSSCWMVPICNGGKRGTNHQNAIYHREREREKGTFFGVCF